MARIEGVRMTCAGDTASRRTLGARFGPPFVVVAVLLAATAATAEPSGPELPVVVLVLSADGGTTGETLATAVEAQIGDLPVRLAVERTAELPPTLPAQVTVAAEIAERLSAGTVFWLDVSIPDRVFVYLSERGGSRVLMRAVDAAGEAERVESVALIVRGLVEAILGGGTIGIALPPPPPPPPPLPEPPAPPDRHWLGLQLAYALDFFSPEATLLQGLDAGLLFHVHENWSLFAAYRILTAAEVAADGIDLRVDRHPVDVGVRFRWPIDDWDFGASLFGVVDYLTAAAGSRTADMTATAPENVWLGGLGLLVHAGYRIAGSFRLFLDGGLDVYFNDVDYVVEGSAGSRVVLGSRSFSPRLMLGLWVDLL